MRKHRITATDAASLLSGHTPQGRPELDELANALSEFRVASFESTPRPSAALLARVDVGKPSAVFDSKSAFDADMIETTSSTSRDNRSQKRPVRKVFAWIAGLGLGLKIALGATVAAAAATGAGAAGVLPFGSQQAFDEVVSIVIPAAEPVDGTDDGTDGATDGDPATDPTVDGDATEGYDPADGNFGGWVSDQAKDKPGTGKEFGGMVSDEAKNKPHTPHPGASDGSQVAEGDENGSDDDEVSQGNGPQSGHTPAPGKKAR
jgi:hypothetical protein